MNLKGNLFFVVFNIKWYSWLRILAYQTKTISLKSAPLTFLSKRIVGLVSFHSSNGRHAPCEQKSRNLTKWHKNLVNSMSSFALFRLTWGKLFWDLYRGNGLLWLKCRLFTVKRGIWYEFYPEAISGCTCLIYRDYTSKHGYKSIGFTH